METEPQPTIIDQIFDLLEQLILPNWSNLIALLPWVVIALVVVFLVFTAWQWRRAGARNESRVPRPAGGGAPPPGVHMPGPSRWPFVVPIGAVLILFSFALPPQDSGGATVGIFNPWLFTAGLVVTVIAVWGWLLEAMREWRATAAADGHGGALVVHGQAGATSAVVEHPQPAPGVSTRRSGRWPLLATLAVVVTLSGLFFSPALVVGGIILGIIAVAGWFLEANTQAAAYSEPPPGVHLPGPSPWPFLAPIAATVMLFGVIFSPILIVGGLIVGVIAVAGWLIDAGREYQTTEEVGHAVPLTRDPAQVWPKRLVRVFAVVIVGSVLITIAPLGISWLNSLTPAEASPTPIAVPAVPEISASNAVSFDIGTLIVPAARPFDLVFNNNQAGVPHNVEIADGPGRATVYLDGEVITGVASITYKVPALAEGDYYFRGKIHPNMNGTVKAMLETGPPPGGQPAPGASPAEQASPTP